MRGPCGWCFEIRKQTGQRKGALAHVGEHLGINLQTTLGTGANVRCDGNGRKQRAVPLTSAVAALLKA